MNDTKPNEAVGQFEEPPYFRIAAEVVSDTLALCAIVEQMRPEIRQLPGMYHLMVDTRSGLIEVSKTTPIETEDGSGRRHIIVEQIAIDPTRPATFGASVLKTVRIDGPPSDVH